MPIPVLIPNRGIIRIIAVIILLTAISGVNYVSGIAGNETLLNTWVV